MPTLRFTSTVKIRGINPYLLISAARARLLKPGWRRPMPVLVRINGKPAKPWPINLMPVGNGSFYLYLHGVVRKASATNVGDRVDAEVRFDSDYRNGPQHPAPRWFTAALRKTPVALRNWRALIPSRKKEVVRHLARLKSPEARTRNLQAVLRALSGEPMRFMARDWRDGR